MLIMGPIVCQNLRQPAKLMNSMEERDMNSPLLGASGFDLDALDAFLMSDRAPEHCMQLSDLDGFLAGIAIGPELIMPSEWLPVIWGGAEPEFESMEEAQRILNATMGRYNEILHLLQHAPDEFEPIFWTTKDGEAVAADWAEGFMEAVELRPSGMGGVAGFGRRQATARADRRAPARRGRRSDHPR